MRVVIDAQIRLLNFEPSSTATPTTTACLRPGVKALFFWPSAKKSSFWYVRNYLNYVFLMLGCANLRGMTLAVSLVPA